MKNDSLIVKVPERPVLSHIGGSISFLPSSLLIHRIEGERRVSTQGAHLHLFVPANLLLDCFGRRSSIFNFSGPYLGQLTECDGLGNYEGGGFKEHAVTELQISVRVEIGNGTLHLELTGKLSPRQQSDKHWQMPIPLTAFEVQLDLPIAEAGSLFYDRVDEMQSAIQRRLEQFIAN